MTKSRVVFVGNYFMFKNTDITNKMQGWEFAQWFSEQIARFLRKNERMSDAQKKAIRSFAHLWLAT